MDEVIGLNIGGHTYTTTRSTLIRYPNSMFGIMFSDRVPSAKDAQGNFFIDRDGKIFRYILNFLRTSELVLPEGYKELDMLAKEADFYQIQELVTAISDKKYSMKIAKRGRMVKIEIREYEQPITSAYQQNGIYTDWSIYGSYDVLIAVNQAMVYGRKLSEFSTLFPDDFLHISWYNKSKYNGGGYGSPTALPTKPRDVGDSRRTVSTEVTEQIFAELFSHGYGLSSKLDSVSSIQNIDPKLKFVTLKSANTYIYSKTLS